MANIGDLVVSIVGNTTQFDTAVDRSKKHTEELATVLEGFRRQVENVDKKAALFANTTNVLADKQRLLKQQIEALIDNGIDPASKEIQELKAQFDKLGDEIKQVGEAAEAVKKKIDFSALADKLYKTGKSLTKWVTLPIVGLGVAAVKASADLEMQQAAFETMLGSAEKATVMLEDLRALAAKTPFNLKDLGNASKTLLSFGVAADKILPTVKQIGDVAQGNAQRFQSLSLAFAQVQATGRLMGQDLLQMVNAGFNPLQQMAEETGQSMAQLKEDMEAGAISAEMVADSFKAATEEGGRFFEGMEKASQTLTGRLSTLWDTIIELGRSFGNVLLPLVKDATLRLTRLAERFTDLGVGTKTTILVVAGLTAAIGPLLLGISATIKAVNTLSTALTFLHTHPVFLAITAGLALAAAIISIQKAIEGARIRKFADEMGNLAAEATFTWKEIRTISRGLEDVAEKGTDARVVISEMSAVSGIAKSVFIEIALANKNITGEFRAQLEIMKEQEVQRAKQVAFDDTLEGIGKRLEREKQAEEAARNAQAEASRAATLKMLADLAEEVKRLNDLTYTGGISEIELQERKIKLREQLRESIIQNAQLGLIDAATAKKALTDNDAIMQINIARLAELQVAETDLDATREVNAEAQTDRYDMELEALEAQAAEIQKLIDLEVKRAGTREEFGIMRQGELAQTIAGIRKERDEYLAAGVDALEVNRWATDETLKARDKEYAATLSLAGQTVANIRAARDDEIEYTENAYGYLIHLAAGNEDRIVELEKEKTDKLNAIRDKAAEVETARQRDVFTSLMTGTLQFFAAIQSLQQAATAEKIADLEREQQAVLRANGFEEKSTIERLREELQAAQEANDEKTANELKTAIARQLILDDYAKKKADIEYQGALEAWNLNVVTGLGNYALAIINALTSKFPIATTAFVAATGIPQLLALQKAKPQPPALAEGGIVQPRQGGTLATIGEGGIAEAIIPLDRLGEILAQIPQPQTNVVTMEPVNTHLVVQMDSRVILDKIFPATQNGTVLIDARAVH